LLDASRLVHEAPKVYATFLLWLLAELFEQLPERGDADKPLLALFFDEAHLLFAGTPKALQDRLEQVVRLIRSKGVGVYFVTQSPADLPDDVLAQLVCASSTACAHSPPRSRNPCGRWPRASGRTRRSMPCRC
jgi:DNA helicase HerA-like ATPase